MESYQRQQFLLCKKLTINPDLHPHCSQTLLWINEILLSKCVLFIETSITLIITSNKTKILIPAQLEQKFTQGCIAEV